MEYKTLKFNKLKVGQKVKIKKTVGRFEDEYQGRIGIIERLDEGSDLDVKINFGDDYYDGIDWGNHKDIKRIVEDVEV